jgi:hypothetical protein
VGPRAVLDAVVKRKVRGIWEYNISRKVKTRFNGLMIQASAELS